MIAFYTLLPLKSSFALLTTLIFGSIHHPLDFIHAQVQVMGAESGPYLKEITFELEVIIASTFPFQSKHKHTSALAFQKEILFIFSSIAYFNH